jgi:hypothetical protein
MQRGLSRTAAAAATPTLLTLLLALLGRQRAVAQRLEAQQRRRTRRVGLLILQYKTPGSSVSSRENHPSPNRALLRLI